MVLFHIPRPASNVESQATDKWYLKTAFVRYVQPMNVSPVPWSCHPPAWVPWEKERKSGQFYGFTSEVFLYLDLFCAYEEDMNILQSIGVLSSKNVIFASTIGTVVSIDQ